MLYADDAGIVSQWAEGFAKMMTVIVTVFEAAGLTVCEKYDRGNAILQTPDQTTFATPLAIEEADQRYKQTTQFLYSGGIIDENADLSPKTKRRIRLMRACLKRFGPELYDRTTAALSLKVRMMKAEVIETLLYRCETWTLRAEHFVKLRTAHYQVPLRVIGFQRRLRTIHSTLSHATALKMTRCESIEQDIRERWLFFAGGVARLMARWHESEAEISRQRRASAVDGVQGNEGGEGREEDKWQKPRPRERGEGGGKET